MNQEVEAKELNSSVLLIEVEEAPAALMQWNTDVI